jgi:hypothetical protein
MTWEETKPPMPSDPHADIVDDASMCGNSVIGMLTDIQLQSQQRRQQLNLRLQVPQNVMHVPCFLRNMWQSA